MIENQLPLLSQDQSSTGPKNVKSEKELNVQEQIIECSWITSGGITLCFIQFLLYFVQTGIKVKVCVLVLQS